MNNNSVIAVTTIAFNCLTLNFSESPSVAGESSLSDVLESQSVPERYFLTPKTCKALLRFQVQRTKINKREYVRLALTKGESLLELTALGLRGVAQPG